MFPKLEAFDHIHVNVAKRSASEIWYREVLGLARDPDGNPFEITTYDHSAFIKLRQGGAL